MKSNDTTKIVKTSERLIRKFKELDPCNQIDAEDLIIEVLMLDNFRIDKSILIYSIDELFEEVEKKFESNLTLATMRTILRLMKRNYFGENDVRALAIRHWFTKYTLETYSTLSEDKIDNILDEVNKYKQDYADRQEEYREQQAKTVRK